MLPKYRVEIKMSHPKNVYWKYYNDLAEIYKRQKNTNSLWKIGHCIVDFWCGIPPKCFCLLVVAKFHHHCSRPTTKIIDNYCTLSVFSMTTYHVGIPLSKVSRTNFILLIDYNGFHVDFWCQICYQNLIVKLALKVLVTKIIAYMVVEKNPKY